MSKRKELADIERALETISNSINLQHYMVLIKSVEMFWNICGGEQISGCLTKQKIMDNIRTIKPFIDEHAISDIKTLIIGSKKAEPYVQSYNKLKKEIAALGNTPIDNVADLGFDIEDKDEFQSSNAPIDKKNSDVSAASLFMDEDEYEDETQAEEAVESKESKGKISKDDKSKNKTNTDGNSAKIKTKKIFYIGVAIFSVVALIFLAMVLNSMLQDVLDKKNKKNNPQAQTQQERLMPPSAAVAQNNIPTTPPPPTNLSVKNSLDDKFNSGNSVNQQNLQKKSASASTQSVQAQEQDVEPAPQPIQEAEMVKTGTKPAPSAFPEQDVEPAPQPIQEAEMVKTGTKPAPSAFPAIPVSSVEKSPGGICRIVPKYANPTNKYVYYIKSADNRYIPAYQNSGWNGEGIKVEEKTVGLSVDEKNGLVEVEDGKYLPIELFSACSLFKN